MLKFDLQFFAEDGDDSLDLDSLLEEFENEWEDETPETEGAEVEVDEESVEDDQVDVQETEEDTTPSQPNPNDEDEARRNRAFADLRRQAEENKRYADFINQLAHDNGVSPDEILKRYQERQLEAQAEQQGVPVEHLRKLNDTEGRLSHLEQQLFNERLENQLQGIISKYGENEPLIRSTFEYMAQIGIDPMRQNVDLEKLYRAANLDTIIQQEVEKSRQSDLANKKKRQDSASIGNGTSVSPSNNDLSDEDVDAILKKFDIKI